MDNDRIECPNCLKGQMMDVKDKDDKWTEYQCRKCRSLKVLAKPDPVCITLNRIPQGD
jgi:hypothetical protein